MSHEHKKACERIATLCSKSTQPTKRIEQIFDVALEALGMTANQREFEIRTMRQTALQRKRNRAS
jgi:hypothetical protein